MAAKALSRKEVVVFKKLKENQVNLITVHKGAVMMGDENTAGVFSQEAGATGRHLI